VRAQNGTPERFPANAPRAIVRATTRVSERATQQGGRVNEGEFKNDSCSRSLAFVPGRAHIRSRRVTPHLSVAALVDGDAPRFLWPALRSSGGELGTFLKR
jgi:hypothetical protein